MINDVDQKIIFGKQLLIVSTERLACAVHERDVG